jgi:endonuclease VIII
MRVDYDRPLAGRRIESVSSRGKHLLITFSGDLILHTHLRMNGSWHLYRVGERWRRPARDMRLLIETTEYVAVAFTVPVAEFLTGRDLARHRDLQSLGPDLLDPAFERDEVLRRMRALERVSIADALLNQRVLAGIGNEFKSEVLFVSRVNPFRSVADLPDDTLGRIVDEARKLLGANVLERRQTLSPAFGRRTTRSLDPVAKLWVYGRGGKPCRACGSLISSTKTGVDARLTYWCPVCQPASG